MDVINLVISFNLGLLSTPHCLAMCGGIITALSMAGPGSREAGASSRYSLVIAYNVGRIASYAVAGAIAGLAGKQIVFAIMPASAHNILRIIAAAILVLIGLNISGWLPGLGLAESWGMKFWGLIQPLARHFKNVSGISGALITGAIWGWLPCGLVYSVLLWSLSSGDAFSGALLLLVFGLGTLPGMLTAGFLGNELVRLLKRPALRKAGGLIIIIFGIISFLLPPPHHYSH
jgi:sulfite exporter TauE/SafE